MSQSLNCPSCQSLLLLPANQPGRQGLCPRCKHVIQLPGYPSADSNSAPIYLQLMTIVNEQVQCSPDNGYGRTRTQSTSLGSYPPSADLQSTLKGPPNKANFQSSSCAPNPTSNLGPDPNWAALYTLCEKALESRPLAAFHAHSSFEQKGELGKGGMGVVYRVIDKRLGRHAALKVLKTTSADREARFLREARITAKLDHPSIPPVYEIGQSKRGELYLLMRVIEGETLQTLIKNYQKKLDPRELRSLLEVMVKVCEALAYAHSQGILHRDLKPANIMVGAFGEVLVMDWGLAKDRSSESDLKVDKSKELSEEIGLTQQGALLGTLGYMPPEQVQGEELDERSDVFALGAILTEILTGSAPIAGESNTLLMIATLDGQISSPRDRDSRIPKVIDFIASAALAINKEERTPSAEIFSAQLKALLLDEEVPHYNYSVSEQTKRLIKKRSGLLLGITLGALFLSLAGVSYLKLMNERERSEWAAIESQRRLESEKIERKKAEERVRQAGRELGTAKIEAERAKAILALFQEARQLLGRGANKDKIIEKINAALKAGERTATQLLAAAKICDEANFHEKQESLLREVIESHPPAYEAYFNLHLLTLKKGNHDFLVTKPLWELFQLSKKRGDENEFTLFYQAFKLTEVGKNKEALALYNKIEIKYTRQFPLMYGNRGVIWQRLGDNDAAFNDYNKAISINPKYAGAYVNRGFLRQTIGDYDDALKDFNKAISINPENASAFYNRGVLRHKLGDRESALNDFNKAISINPKYGQAYVNRGTLREGMGDKEAALKDYNAAIAISPKIASAFFNRGVLRQKAGDKEAALNDYNKALAITPEDARIFCNRGAVHQELGHYEAALNDYSKAVSINPKHETAYLNRGLLRKKLGNNNGALSDYNTAISIKSDFATAYYNRGIVRKEMEDRGGALKDYSKAISINPRYELAYVSRGTLRKDTEDHEGALQDFNKAILINPKAGIAFANRGFLYKKIGQPKQAISDLKKFLLLQPNHSAAPMVRSNIEQLEKKLK